MSARTTSDWSLTGHSAGERALLTVIALAVMGTMFWAYSQAVRPFVKAPEMKDWNREFHFEIPVDNASPARGMADQYLAHVPWVKEATYASTPYGYIYYKTWSPDADNKKAVRFTPFAMIWIQKGRQEGEPPYTIASESAYITFEKELEFENGQVFLNKPGRPEGGGLERDVLITGPDGIQLKTRNVVFDANAYRLWTADHIDLVFRKNQVNALGMQIDLIPGEQQSDEDGIDVAGVKSVRLLRNVALYLQEDRRDAAKPADDAKRDSERKKKPKTPEIVQIFSDGSLEYIVQTNTATLEDHVRIFRPTDPGMADTLVTDNTGSVELIFEEEERKSESPPNPPDGSQSPLATSSANGSSVKTVSAAINESSGVAPSQKDKKDDRFRGLNSSLSFRKLHARGKSVTLTSQSNHLTARGATSIQYDTSSRTASLSSSTKSPNGAVLPVLVRQKASVMACPQITLMHDEKSTITHAWCSGPGTLDSYDEQTGRIHELSAEWKKELRKFPDPQSSFDIIELDGQSLIRQPEQQSGLLAEHIRVWTDPFRRNTDKDKKDPSPGQKNRSSSARLRCMLAWQNVAFVYPEMQVRTEQLEVYFQDRPTPSPTVIGSTRNVSRRNLLLTAERRPKDLLNMQQRQRADIMRVVTHSDHHSQAFASTVDHIPVRNHAENAPRQDGSSGSNTAGSDKSRHSNPGKDKPAPSDKQGNSPQQPEDGPYDVEADLVQVLVLQGPNRDDSEVARILTKGHVKVVQQHVSGEEPLQIAGDELHVENRSKTDSVLHVLGRPAHVRDRGLYIEGKDIYFDRAGNTARVDGVGRLQLPVSQTVDGKPIKAPVPLDIFWKEQMNFDGQTAHFVEGVQSKMDDERTKSEMRCSEMEVVLTDRLDFSGRENRRQVKVRIVNCKGGVDVESDEFDAGRRIEIRRVHAAEFELDQTTGETRAQGPGIIRRWQFGRERPSGLGPLAKVQANSAIDQNKDQWTYTQVDFSGHMSGNMNQRFSKFHNDVRVLYGPVANETGVIDRDKLGEEAGWMGCDTLTITQHPEQGMLPAFVVLEADGNARLEGHTYYGQADNISYDGAKGNILLLGHSKRAATLWRQTVRGGGYDQQNGQRFDFNPRTNKLVMHQVESLNGVQ